VSVYVITCRDLGVAKIGYSNDPLRRVQFLKTGSPAPVKLEAVIPADERNERELHKAFADNHSHGEWFRICAGIEELITKFATGVRRRKPFPDSPLSRYLAERGITAQAFAAEINTTAGSMSRSLNGHQQPRLELMRAIVRATNGAVDANDIIFGIPKAKAA
jgi:hypothetical protein